MKNIIIIISTNNIITIIKHIMNIFIIGINTIIH